MNTRKIRFLFIEGISFLRSQQISHDFAQFSLFGIARQSYYTKNEAVNCGWELTLPFKRNEWLG